MALQEFTPSHPYAEIFPLHDEGQVFFDFADDIKANGLQEKIILYQEKVLDGRRRERGCRRAGVEPKYKEFKGSDAEALAFVMSKNLHHRHLGEGERKLAAAKYATAKVGQPKKESSQLATIAAEADANNDVAKPEEPKTSPPTNADAAETFEVSEADVDRAKKVLEGAIPEIVKAVESGEITVSDAAKVASKPKAIQRKALKAFREGKAKSVAGAAKQIEDQHFPTEKPLPETLTEAARKAFAAGKVEADEKQIAAFAKFDEETQDALLKSIIDGKQTLAKAIESGCVPDPTIDEIIAEKNSALESFCRKLMKLVNEELPQDEWLDHMNRRGGAIQKFKDGCEAVRSAKGYRACPMCKGSGCSKCLNTGRVTKFQYDQLV